MKKMKLCHVCETSLDIDDMYCSKCGAEQEIREDVENEILIKDTTCPYCNAKLDKNDTFCTSCGTKLEI